MTSYRVRGLVVAGTLAFASLGCATSGGSAPHASGARYAENPSGAYAVTAEVRAKQGKEDALRVATLPLVEQVRNEPNNLVYFLHENREAPGHFKVLRAELLGNQSTASK